MLYVTFAGFVLVAATVVIHCTCLTLLLIGVKRALPRVRPGFVSIFRVLLLMSWWLSLAHLAEILLWGVFYRYCGGLTDVESAFYFSGITYTTIGYGDLVLAKPWRAIAPVEGLTGVLMCGLSASFFVSVVGQIYRSLNPGSSGDPTM